MKNNFDAKPGVYLLINKVNGKIYVGKTYNIRRRLWGHKSSITQTSRASPIVLAIRKYGWENFDVVILEQYDFWDDDMLLQKESEWIKKLDSANKKNGYNILTNWVGPNGFHHTDETKQRLGELASKRYSGENNPMFGKKHSEETKKKISGSLRAGFLLGAKKTMLGKKHSQETKDKIRQSLRNSINTRKDNRKQVEQIHPETNQIVKVWESITAAAIAFGGNMTTISSVCHKNRKTAFGFKWKFVDKTSEKEAQN